jgi:hypothetical protein
VSGKFAIKVDDGHEFIASPGYIASLPSGHDAWGVGDEHVVVIDWFGASNRWAILHSWSTLALSLAPPAAPAWPRARESATTAMLRLRPYAAGSVFT